MFHQLHLRRSRRALAAAAMLAAMLATLTTVHPARAATVPAHQTA
ncbi:hypothetical protein [Edaphosphingomonas haloaromaticamans]|nr:hypothetical protein [Sphingomonas haloaromaticamans]